jgi:low temperature requirement protein LtrA
LSASPTGSETGAYSRGTARNAPPFPTKTAKACRLRRARTPQTRRRAKRASARSRDANWHFESATAAVLGFAAVAGIWWLYFDRQASVLRGSTMSVVVYSYAHIPLLIGLAAMSAGLRLLIERAGDDHLGTGASAALLGGAALYLVSLVGTRTVTVTGSRRLGVSLKLGAAAVILGMLASEELFPPVAVAAGLACVLIAVVFAERTL